MGVDSGPRRDAGPTDPCAAGTDDASAARRALHAGCNATLRSRVAPFVRAARTIRKHIDGIVAYIETGLSNARTEGMNGKIRVLTRRAYGFHDVWNFISMITLCCSGLLFKPRHARSTHETCRRAPVSHGLWA